ncbi:MAG: hypothetical protein WCK15_24750 [Pirellula sp.]
MPGILESLSPIGFGSQRCPDCEELITSESINIKEGVALCPQCGKLSRISELNVSGVSVAEILAHPPAGCSVISDGQRVTVTASLRSLAGFLFPAGLALFWNSIISPFVLIVIAGLYSNLIGPLPNWFPAPGLNDGKPEMNGGPMDLGMTLFLCVCLIPFVTVGIGMAGMAIIFLIGKVEVIIDEFDSYVATGFGIIRWKKRFDAREVKTVEFGTTPLQSEGGANMFIEIVANRSVKFGFLLQPDRRAWLRAVLRKVLLPGSGDNYNSKIPALAWLSRRSP